MDYWFNSSIEKSLQESLKLAQSFLHDTKDQADRMSEAIGIRFRRTSIVFVQLRYHKQNAGKYPGFQPHQRPGQHHPDHGRQNFEIGVVGPDLRGHKTSKNSV